MPINEWYNPKCICPNHLRNVFFQTKGEWGAGTWLDMSLSPSTKKKSAKLHGDGCWVWVVVFPCAEYGRSNFTAIGFGSL
jgi:hypothetical protein